MTIRTTVLPGGTPQVSIDATANAETYQLPAGYAAGRRLIIRRVDSGATYTATVTVPTGGSIDGVTDGTVTVGADLEVTFEAGDGNAWQTTGSLKAIAAAVAARPELTGAYAAIGLPAGITAARRYEPHFSAYNKRPGNTAQLRAAIGKAVSGTGYARLLFAGTSITAGLGSGRPDVASISSYAKTLLTARGIPLGGSGIAHTWCNLTSITDGRWAFGTGWAGSGLDVVYQSSSTASSAATFTSDAAGTTVDVLTLKGSGAFTVTINGGAPQSVSASTGSGVTVNTFTAAVSAGQTVVVTVTSGTVYLLGVQVRGASGLLVTNAGIGSSQSLHWANQNAWNVGKVTSAAGVYQPDCVFFEMPINDAMTGVAISTVTANVTTSVNQWRGVGSDVVLQVSPKPQTSSVTDAAWLTYQQAMYSLADSLDCPLIDYTDALGTSASRITHGMNSDGIHVTQPGEAAMGALAAQLCLA